MCLVQSHTWFISYATGADMLYVYFPFTSSHKTLKKAMYSVVGIFKNHYFYYFIRMFLLF